MSPALKKRLQRTALLCAGALLIGAAFGFAQIEGEKAARQEQNGTGVAIAGLQLGGPFTLTDQNGASVTEKSFPGKYRLIYFGFTSCPAVCPTELRKMTQALNALGPVAEKIQPLFITVDPARDTPKALKGYVSLFHPRLVGLTGTQAQIDQVLHEYKIYAGKVQDSSSTEYTMSHSSFTYLISPQGELLAIYRDEDKADAMAADIKARVINSETRE